MSARPDSSLGPSSGWRAGLARLRQQADQTGGQWQRMWRARAPRERKLLLVAGSLLGAALVWTVLVEPAMARLNRLDAEIPRLQAQRAEMLAVIADAASLQGSAQAALDDVARQDALTDSLSRAGLTAVTVLTQPEPGRWNLEVTDALAADLMQWLADAVVLTRLRPETLDLSRVTDAGGEPRPGRVRGAMRLFDPADEQGGSR